MNLANKLLCEILKEINGRRGYDIPGDVSREIQIEIYSALEKIIQTGLDAHQEATLRAMWEETKENYCENTFWTEEVVSPGFCTEIQAQCRKLSPLKSNVPCTFENCPLVAIARKELEK